MFVTDADHDDGPYHTGKVWNLNPKPRNVIAVKFRNLPKKIWFPVDDLKKVLLASPLSQRAISGQISQAFGVHVDQSSISRYLNGKTYPCHDFIRYLETAFPAGIYVDGAEMCMIPTGNMSSTWLIPDRIKAMYMVMQPQAIPNETVIEDAQQAMEEEQEQESAMPQTGKFPVSKAYEIAEMARKAQVNEGRNFTFSTRKLIQWGQVYNVLLSAGFNPKDSLGGAYVMCVMNKQTGDDRKILKDFFQAKLGFDAKIPTPPKTKGELAHPMQFYMELLMRASIPVWAHGPAGCGKTFAAMAIAEKLYPLNEERDRSFIRFQGSIDKNVDDLVGGFEAENGSTVREYGPLALAMKEGIPFIYDEPTACLPEVNFEFHAVLEGNPLIITKFRGERIDPEPGHCIVCCDNTVGQGEANEYVGTNMMNEAFRDRFVFLEFDFMPKQTELDVVENQVETFNSSLFLGYSMPPVATHEDEVVDRKKGKVTVEFTQSGVESQLLSAISIALGLEEEEEDGETV